MSATKPMLSPSPHGSKPAEERKPYRTPCLTVYGSVRDLTLEGGSHRDKDGGNNALNNRT